jgi:hypothetical protein
MHGPIGKMTATPGQRDALVAETAPLGGVGLSRAAAIPS